MTKPGDSEPAASSPAAQSPAAEIVHIPVGKFVMGSLPGEPGRRPDREPLSHEVELGPFRIDPTPYPGDGQSPPRVGVSYEEAATLCAERQGRLCTELEWERACKGATSARTPNGELGCSANSICMSSFEVAAMTQLPEWTASQFGPDAASPNERVVKGAPKEVEPGQRRCAVRTPQSQSPTAEVGFRCCYGAPNALRVREPGLGAAYAEVDIGLEELARLLKSSPRTAALADPAPTFFRSPDGARTVLDRGPGDPMGFTLTTKPVEWRPERGLHVLVLTGRSGEKTSFVLAYHITGAQKILAASFIMRNEPGPVALAYATSIRPRMHLSTCWGCPGENGKLLFREPEELVFLQP